MTTSESSRNAKPLLSVVRRFLIRRPRVISQIVELHAYLERGSEDPGTWLKVTQL